MYKIVKKCTIQCDVFIKNAHKIQLLSDFCGRCSLLCYVVRLFAPAISLFLKMSVATRLHRSHLMLMNPSSPCFVSNIRLPQQGHSMRMESSCCFIKVVLPKYQYIPRVMDYWIPGFIVIIGRGRRIKGKCLLPGCTLAIDLL